jgi:hypothetical protein
MRAVRHAAIRLLAGSDEVALNLIVRGEVELSGDALVSGCSLYS